MKELSLQVHQLLKLLLLAFPLPCSGFFTIFVPIDSSKKRKGRWAGVSFKFNNRGFRQESLQTQKPEIAHKTH